MKKFIISLLLICTICLGCFALTACDENDSDTNNASRVELVRNDEFGFQNQYIFRVYYPQEWFDLGWAPSIIITCKFDTSDEEPAVFDKGYYAQWLQTDPNYSFSDRYSIVPNTWIYFILTTEIAPNYLLVSVCSSQQENPILLDFRLDLRDTFKYQTAQ